MYELETSDGRKIDLTLDEIECLCEMFFESNDFEAPLTYTVVEKEKIVFKTILSPPRVEATKALVPYNSRKNNKIDLVVCSNLKIRSSKKVFARLKLKLRKITKMQIKTDKILSEILGLATSHIAT